MSVIQNSAEFKKQIALARTEIKNLREQISALKNEHLKEINALKSLISHPNSVSSGSAESNTSPTTSHAAGETIRYRPIGHIETTFANKRAVPRQPSIAADCRGRVIIDSTVYNNPEHACDGLKEFSHMWIIFHMHMTESNSVPAKVSPPRLRGERRGVFATRSPHRPCPIGLSLVKIVSVEGNRIEFSGVDMVSGTPVLDVKPYIPQYDYPSMQRPPTEGDVDSPPIARLQISSDTGRLSPRLTRPVGIDTGSPAHTDEGTDSPNTPQVSSSSLTSPLSPSPESPVSVDLLEITADSSRSPLDSRPTERGAPDGQERFTPPQSANLVTHEGIRIPNWVSDPVSQRLAVRFSEDVLSRLNELIGDRASMFKSNLESLLAEDPRSMYVRNRYPNHEYNCVLEDLSISCIFDDQASTCTVIAVRNAEDMRN